MGRRDLRRWLRGGCLRRRDARRAEHHRHVAAVLLGPLLDDRELVEVLREAVEDHLTALGVGHLTPAEHDRHLDLVARLEEALDVALLGVVVMLGDLRPELDLPDVDLLLVLAGGFRLLGLLVLVLRVVQDPDHGRLRLGRDLHEVEVLLLCPPQGVLGAHDPHLLAGLVDETDLGNADAFVDAGGIALRRLPVEPSRDRHLAGVGARRQERGAVWERVFNVRKYRRGSTAVHDVAPIARRAAILTGAAVDSIGRGRIVPRPHGVRAGPAEDHVASFQADQPVVARAARTSALKAGAVTPNTPAAARDTEVKWRRITRRGTDAHGYPLTRRASNAPLPGKARPDRLRGAGAPPPCRSPPRGRRPRACRGSCATPRRGSCGRSTRCARRPRPGNRSAPPAPHPRTLCGGRPRAARSPGPAPARPGT